MHEKQFMEEDKSPEHACGLVSGWHFNCSQFRILFLLVLYCLVFSDSNFYVLFCFSFQDLHSFSADHGLPWGPVFKALAVCHSLIVWEGKIQGDPLDVKMFEATNWVKLRFFCYANSGELTLPSGLARYLSKL